MFLFILLLAILGLSGLYGSVLRASARAAEDLSRQMTSLYAGPHEFLVAHPFSFPFSRDGYDTVCADLSELGFVHLGSIEDRTVSDALPTMRTFSDVYTNDSGDTFCATYRIQTPECDLQVVEFLTQFEDGTFLTTTNSTPAGWMERPPEIDTTIIEHGSTLQLSSRHAERLEEAKVAGEKRVLAIVSLEDVLATQSAFVALEVRHRQSVGYLTYDEVVTMSARDTTPYLPGARRFFHWSFKRHVPGQLSQ